VKTPRAQVYRAIDSERYYQDALYGATLSSERPGNGDRSVDEYALYIVGYAHELMKQAAKYSNPDEKLHAVRKVAGLCVACMEQHGAPLRDMPVGHPRS
jgi:hypothetical protein